MFQAGMGVFGTPAFELDAVELDGETMAVAESVIDETPFCRLRRFSTGRAEGRRVLLCAPLAGHRSVVMRDAIAALVAVADVCVTDWVDARDVPCEAGRFGLDEYVLMLQRFMTRLDPGQLDVVAVCQATVPALAAASRLAADGQEVRTLVLMGGPIDARQRPTMLGRMAASMSDEVFEQACTGAVPPPYRGAGRTVYPGFLQLPTLASGQPDRMVTLVRGAMPSPWWEDRASRSAVQSAAAGYAAMMDMPAEFLLDTMHTVFQQFLLPRGQWRVAGELVRPAALRTTRLLTVEGDRDAISGAGQTHAAHVLCTGLPASRRKAMTIADCDHYGLFSGEVWRCKVFPVVHAWLAGPADGCVAADQ